MAKKPGAKNSSGKYLDPAARYQSRFIMRKKTGEFMSPGKAVAKVAAKVAGNAVKKAATKKATKQSAKRVETMRKAEKKAESAKAERTFAKKPSSSVKVVKPQGKASAKFRNEKEAERIWHAQQELKHAII
jgi:hypothetical protein